MKIRRIILDFARAWLKKHGTSFPSVREKRETLEKQLWVRGLPHFALLTPDRRLSWSGQLPGWSADSVTVRLREMLRGS